MALQLRVKRPVITSRLTGAFVAIAALLLQPFGALPIVRATSAFSQPTATVNRISPYVSSSVDGELYQSLTLSFNYDSQSMDATPSVDTFQYGWSNSSSSGALGTLNGATGNDAGEIGSVSISLPSSALSTGLTVNAAVSANSDTDQVVMTNIKLEGTLKPVLEQNAVCDSGCEWATVAAAVAGEAGGSTITIKADSPKAVTSNILIDKPLTITGQAGASIATSGGNLVFTTTADAITISNLIFNKSDTTYQVLINVQGDDTVIDSNVFNGQYTAANDTSSRAIVASGGANNLVISGNKVNGMRQPAYLNNGSTGFISNNYVNGTRGWVVEKASDFSFSGNTWDDNAVDIAIIPGVDPADTPNNYSCRLAQMKADNDNANIEDQYPVYCPITPGTSTAYTVNGSTTATENEAGKWWFNRDPNTATPYTFTGAQESTGTGSLFVPAIGTNPSDKFVGEYFVANLLDDTGAISFDYRLADGVATSKANQVYMNLYVNYSSATNYGDCVYNVVATDGSAGWHTLSFAPNGTYDVRTRSSAAPNVCPAKPTDLPATAYVRAISLNVGDTSANDAGVSAYLDNVRVEKVTQTAVYDFEADTTKPTVSLVAPTAGALNPPEIIVDASDDQGLNRVTANVRNAANAIVLSCSPFANGAKSYRLTCAVPTTLPDGAYSVKYNASDTTGNISNTGTINFSVDRSAPDVTIENPSQGAAVRASVAVRGVVTDANPMASYLRITGPNGYVVTSYYSDGRAAHEYAWNTIGLVDGTYTVRFEARDAAGNKDAGSVQDVKVQVDNTKGTTVVSSPSENAIASSDFMVNATSSDDGSGIARGVANLYRADGALLNSCYNEAVSPAQSIRDFNCTVDVDSLEDGDYYLKVNASDKAGNVTNTVIRNFNVDKTDPVLDVTTPQPDSEYTTAQDITVTGTVSDNTDINRVVMFVDASNNGSRQVEREFAAQTGGAFSFTVPAGSLSAGEHRLVVNAYDEANNNTTVWIDFVVNPVPIGIPGPIDGEEEEPGNEPQEQPAVVTPTPASSSNSNSANANPLTSVPSAVQQPSFATAFIAAPSQTTPAAAASETEDGDILGTTATENDEDGDVAGASDKAGWSIGEMAWYWWVVGVLGAMGLWLLIAAGIRRLRGAEA